MSALILTAILAASALFSVQAARALDLQVTAGEPSGLSISFHPRGAAACVVHAVAASHKLSCGGDVER
jgi:hypothetical protein